MLLATHELVYKLSHDGVCLPRTDPRVSYRTSPHQPCSDSALPSGSSDAEFIWTVSPRIASPGRFGGRWKRDGGKGDCSWALLT